MKHLHQRNNKEVVYKNLSKPTQNNAKVKPLSIISREIKPMLLHMLENLLKIDTTKAKKKVLKERRCNWHFFLVQDPCHLHPLYCTTSPNSKNAPYKTSYQSAQRNKKTSWDLLPIFTQTKINSPCNAWLNVTMLQAFHAKSFC